MKINKTLLLLLFALGLFFTSCEDDDDNEVKPISTIDDIEVGLSNNEIGVIGQDFHFNAAIVAGDKIDTVRIKIEPRTGETYESDWSFEIKWDQYKGVKNATVHKHFDIPVDAVEGTYDFIISVEDENGTILEEVRTINIYLEGNLPVAPYLRLFNIMRNNDVMYYNGEFASITDNPHVISRKDTLQFQAIIGGVKEDGIMYLLLIKKSLGHRPETVEDIDFSKAIVYDMHEHKNAENVFDFSNFEADMETLTILRPLPRFVIGAEEDQNGAIAGDKEWESGEYYLGAVYKNATYNMSFYHYIEIEVSLD